MLLIKEVSGQKDHLVMKIENNLYSILKIG
jgi:hypothetical protein